MPEPSRNQLCIVDAYCADASASVGSVLHAFRKFHWPYAGHIVITRAGRYFAVTGIEALLAVSHGTRLEQLPLVHLEPCTVSNDAEHVAIRAARQSAGIMVITDSENRVLGIVPPDRLVSILFAEHNEDIARLGGYLHDSQNARTASEEPVHRRFLHRIPWLIVGLSGALLCAALVSRYEEALGHTVMLMFFLPGIVYLADAVGTQTETVVVRGLSLGVQWRQMLWKEILTGIGIGVTLAILAWPMVRGFWDSAALAHTVSVSILATSTVASLIAMLLPWLFTRAGMDPAYGSGPLATVLQDTLSILIYFTIALGSLK